MKGWNKKFIWISSKMQHLKKYLTFSGRASRKEFLLSYLIALLITALGLDVFLTDTIPLASDITLYISIAYVFIIFFVLSSVTVRRLHDTNRSGWLFIILIITLLNWLFAPMIYSYGTEGILFFCKSIAIVTLVIVSYLLCKKGDETPNSYDNH